MPDDNESNNNNEESGREANFTPYEIYRLMKAESRLVALRPQLLQIRAKLAEFSDLIDFTIVADLTQAAKDALDEIKRENQESQGTQDTQEP